MKNKLLALLGLCAALAGCGPAESEVAQQVRARATAGGPPAAVVMNVDCQKTSTIFSRDRSYTCSYQASANGAKQVIKLIKAEGGWTFKP